MGMDMPHQFHDTNTGRARGIARWLGLCILLAAVSPTGAAPEQAVRTLDAITIEGEIAVPQVLFITSRDYPRYRDGLGVNFRMTTIGVARSLDQPRRLRFVAQSQLVQEEAP